MTDWKALCQELLKALEQYPIRPAGHRALMTRTCLLLNQADAEDSELADEEHEALLLKCGHGIGPDATSDVTPAEMLQRLEQASLCCKDCGLQYGVYSVGCSSSWMGTCQVCGEYKSVTETRDYAYLITGQRKLTALLEALPND